MVEPVRRGLRAKKDPAKGIARSKAAAAALAVCLATFSSSHAFAADDPLATQARARFQEGVTAYDKGDFENARLAFIQAYALKKHPAVLLNLAQSSAKSGRALEASRYFRQLLAESNALQPKQRTEAERGLQDAFEQLGHIDVVAPPGRELTLDDNGSLGSAPLDGPIDVEPGDHRIRAAPTHDSPALIVTVTAVAGQIVRAQLDAPSSPPSPEEPAEPATASTDATPSVPEPTPARVDPPTAATGTDAQKPGLFSRPQSMTPVVLGLTAAGLGLVGTVVFGIVRSAAQSAATNSETTIRNAAIQRGFDGNGDGVADALGVCRSSIPSIQRDFSAACAALSTNRNLVNTATTLTNVSIGVMIAGAVGAGGWYLFGPKQKAAEQKQPAREGGLRRDGAPEMASTVAPYIDRSGGGLTLYGTF